MLILLSWSGIWPTPDKLSGSFIVLRQMLRAVASAAFILVEGFDALQIGLGGELLVALLEKTFDPAAAFIFEMRV